MVGRPGQKGGEVGYPEARGRRLDSEMGVFSARLDSTAQKGLKPKQHLQSLNFSELCLSLAAKLSYRGVAETMNRFLHLSGESALSSSTLADRVEAFGERMSCVYESMADGILESYVVDTRSGVVDGDSGVPLSVRDPDLPAPLDESRARNIITKYNRGRDRDTKLRYGERLSATEASADRCCYILVDDVGVKRQKESRKTAGRKIRKYVENTVVYIQAGSLHYTVTAIGMDRAFKLLVAFLLNSHLMEDHRLIFLTDGATAIRDRIERFFAFREYTIILDWLHLRKKCLEFMSMAVKGTKSEKAAMKEALTSLLWAGNVGKAVRYLRNIRKSKVKSPAAMESLIGYLNRKEPYLPCYAFRHELGLKVSSNRVEKENDLVVASRQKHNGMSWSDNGSGALAVITAASRNGELDSYVANGTISFKLVA